MTNHPGRSPRSTTRMTPAQLADLLQRSGLTPERAAGLALVPPGTLQQYLDGERPIPPSVAGLLCLSCITLGAPAGLLTPWLPAEVAEAVSQ